MRTWKDVAEQVKINDSLIMKHIISNSDFDIREDGTIWTRISRNGQGYLPKGKWRELKSKDNGGYKKVCCYVEGVKKSFKAHRVVYMRFHGELNPNKVINHINGIKTDNSLENLELVDIKVNNAHMYEVLKYDPIQHKRLSFEVAEEIRKLKKEQNLSHKKLAEMYRTSKGHISEIVNFKIWITPDQKVS